MSPLERLLEEAVPDGTFGGARTPQSRRKTPRRGQSRPDRSPEQARRLAALAEEVADIDHRNRYGVNLRYRHPYSDAA